MHFLGFFNFTLKKNLSKENVKDILIPSEERKIQTSQRSSRKYGLCVVYLKKVRCCYFTYPGIVALSGEIHKKNEEFKASFLGHDFFKDKIIQFDFKNKTFGIK
jgi:hypothetical protein